MSKEHARTTDLIAILIPDLRPGGAERMRLQMARVWLQQSYQVEFVLCVREGELLRVLPEGAMVHELGAPRVRNAIRPLVAYLHDRKPVALLAAMWPLTIVAPLAARLAGYRGRVVISEHAPQSLSHAKRGKLHSTVMATSMRMIYPLADARVAVSGGVADDMASLSGMRRERFTVIHNPAALGRVLPRGEGSLPIAVGQGLLVLSVGTLKPVKRHDILIRSFAKLPFAAARLCILGEGSERANLEALVVDLGLQGRVLFPGYQSDTAPWYACADLFVLSSDHEGFGNVIVEALEQGTPVVSTDCPSGPREILDGGKYGTLVPVGDVDALAIAMTESLSRQHDSKALKRRAQDFNVGKAADAYLELLMPDGGTSSP